MRARFLLVLLFALLGMSASPLAAQVTDCVSGCLGNAVIEVTPDGGKFNKIAREPLTGPWTDTLHLQNVGTQSGTWTLDCSQTDGAVCSQVSPSVITLDAMEEGTAYLTYTMGSGGGNLKLWAWGNSSDSGVRQLVLSPGTAPTVSIVAPVNSGGIAVVHNRQPIIRAFISGGSTVDSNAFQLKWRGVNRIGSARYSKRLIEWEVDSASWLNPGDTAVAEVTACSLGGACNTASISVILENNKPIIGFTGQPLEALGSAYSAPFGPGLSLSGMEVETGFATIPYFTRTVARSAGLVYSTRQSYPRAVVAVDLELPPGLGTVDSAKVFLWDGGVIRDSLKVGNPASCTTYGLKRCRAVLQADYAALSSLPTRKVLKIEFRSKQNGQAENIVSDSVEVVLVDRRTTAYGSGWWPSGLLKLVKDGNDRILIGPTGTATIYRGSGDSSYIPPPGNFTGIRRVGATLELAARGSTAKLVFDSTTGRLIKSLDANGNRDSIAYNGATDQITSIVDPVGSAIRFHYNGSGKLDSLISLTGTAARAAGIQIDGSNRLVVDSLAPGSRSYRTTYVYDTYAGTSTYLLTKRIGMLTDTTIVSYDGTRNRPTQTRLPQVQDETGATVNPVITYAAFEKQGMGALRQLDSVYVELKDPRNNWTRSLLNRWRQSVKTWDALGLLGKTQYDGDGFALWSEGKVADSSRAYNAYDSKRRLVKTYIVRAAGDTLRVDSLVYDANHRVIRQISTTGQVTSLTYDTLGNVLTSVTPAGDTTKYFYLYGGMLWKTWAPRAAAPVERIYNATTGYNLWKVIDETGIVADSMVQDRYGRDSVSIVKVIIQAVNGSPTTPKRSWRKSVAFYGADNAIDSAVTYRSNACNDPCAGGPSWPTVDSLTSTRVGHRYDVAGRDTLRISAHTDSTRYSYDRLGRVRARWPSAGATAVVDSTFYDVAGNVKKVRTRRGFSIVTNFDSRNRDTLTVVDSLGTLRKRYSGPLDQITSVWWSSVIDSIGGVNGSVGYRYDQRGRLLSDTSFAGSTAQVTSYTYDTYERPSSISDILGTWTTRYETARGMADTLITPYADTVIYTFDERWRTLGPTIQSGSNPVQTQTLKWNAGQALDTLTRKVGSTVVGRYLRSAGWNEDGAALAPAWIDAGGVNWADSVVYDGLNRVVVRVLRKSNVVAVRDSFTFDPNGNIKTTAGSEQYDRHDRMLSRAGSGCTWSYTYDNGGNLTAASCGGTSWSYTYDPLDRLIAARKNGTLIVRYGYDVLGRRIVKNVYSSSSGGIVAYTRFVYHGGHVAYETTQNGRITLRYTWGRAADDLLAVRDSLGNHVYTVQDRLRSIRAAYTRTGTWQVSLTYGTYGTTVDSTGTLPFELRYRWTGREYDAELGWYYFRARYYAPSERRFMQEDPAGYGGGQNLYAYVDGGPLEYRDPSGLTKDCGNGGCQDPHDWSGVQGLDGSGARVCGMFCGAGGGSNLGDDYASDLVTALVEGSRGRSGCFGQVCGTNMDQYEEYVNNFTQSLSTALSTFAGQPAEKALQTVSMMNPLQFAMIVGGSGNYGSSPFSYGPLPFKNPEVGAIVGNLIQRGRIGAGPIRGGKEGWAIPGAMWQTFIMINEDVFTDRRRSQGFLEGCLVHEVSHAFYGTQDSGPGQTAAAFALANSYATHSGPCVGR